MDATFRPILIAFFLAGLFTIAILTFGVNLALKNNSPQSISDNPALNNLAVSVTTELQKTDEAANASETAMAKSPPTVGLTIVMDAVGGLWINMKTIPMAIYGLITGATYFIIFGGDSAFWVVLGTVGCILIFTIIMTVWKFVFRGEGG